MNSFLRWAPAQPLMAGREDRRARQGCGRGQSRAKPSGSGSGGPEGTVIVGKVLNPAWPPPAPPRPCCTSHGPAKGKHTDPALDS